MLCRWGRLSLLLSGFAFSVFVSPIPGVAQEPRPAESAPNPSGPDQTATERAAEDATSDPEAAQPEDGAVVTEQERRALNLLGEVNTAGGESRRNNNVNINLVNTNAAQELNNRVGITATVVPQFNADSQYFSSEFGNAPRGPIHARSQTGLGWHGNVFWTHQNSAFTARTFFQVGDVQPARENQYGVTVGGQVWKGGFLSINGSQNKIRGQVNGNILIPLPSERIPVTTDPALRAAVQNLIDGFPNVAPNRPDIATRAHNTNSPQLINTDAATGQLNQTLGTRDTLIGRYNFTGQRVDAFQFVRGQNPNTRNKSHGVRLTWNRAWSPSTVSNITLGFDRQGALLLPAQGSEGPVLITGLTRLGPSPSVPLDRAQNRFRYAASAQQIRGDHTITFGGSLSRFQITGSEPDGGLGILQFRNDFGREGIENLLLGTPSTYVAAVGTTYRAFRNWEMDFYLGDQWQATDRLSITMGIRWEPWLKPSDASGRSELLFDSDLNNVAPRFGLAYRLPGRFGVVRAAYGTMFGQIYPATYGQDRLNLPYNFRLNEPAPNLLALGSSIDPNLDPTTARSGYYEVHRDLATPYSHQYNFSWEFEPVERWQLQLGYVGSRTHKLFGSWQLNRGEFIPGIPFISATLNQRRPDGNLFEHLYIHNSIRAYYDAARVTFTRQAWHGLTINASYWFSKAIDLGADYTNTASGGDARSSGGQDGLDVQGDLKGLSDFDQPHALLLQTTYTAPVSGPQWTNWLTRDWTLASVFLLKSGTPFTIESGSDGLGVGNLDGSFGDRPSVVDSSVLGRIVGNPDTSPQLLPAAAFRFINAPQEMRGDIGRNTFRKGKIANINASIARTFTLPSEATMTFRVESNNLFNTPQFAEPGTALAAPNFGQISNTLNEGRTFRFTLRVAF